MKTENIQRGTKVLFTPTGTEFTLEKVTENRVSWYNGLVIQNYKNKIRMTTITRSKFEQGVLDGDYVIL